MPNAQFWSSGELTGERCLDTVMIVTSMIMFSKDVHAPVLSTWEDIASISKRGFTGMVEGLGPEIEILSWTICGGPVWSYGPLKLKTFSHYG